MGLDQDERRFRETEAALVCVPGMAHI